MTNLEMAQLRLYNQHVSKHVFKTPAEIVIYMGAIQAQNYAGAKWAVGLRLQKSNDADIDKAMANGSIIRTHVLRPTWHFVSPADVRWMIDLSAPRIKAMVAPAYRAFQLDNAVFTKTNDALAKALEGNKQVCRNELAAVLEDAGVKTNELRFIHLLMRAEMDKVICSGGRQGKQFTYALFDDRVPHGSPFVKEEALAALAKRYFISHGPATLADFAWWSGLSAADAKAALEIVKPLLTVVTGDGVQLWTGKDQPDVFGKAPLAHLLAAFDEFAVAYKDRTATVHHKYITQARNVIFDPAIVVNNQVVGTWKRIDKGKSAELILNPFGKLSKVHEAAVENAVERYLKFIK